MTDLNEQLVTVVIVTYGDRKALLTDVVDALQDLGLMRVVIVDNGAAWALKNELSPRYPNLVDVIELGKNMGSAVGFSVGIQRALDLGAEYVWLLDDDNRPRDDTLRQLLAVYSQEVNSTPRDHLGVLAFRPERRTNIDRGVPLHRIIPRTNSFRRFHVLDIPYKIWCSTPWGKSQPPGALPTIIELEDGSYGGLLFHRDLIHAIGLPNRDFVLYGDDIEFTSRITRRGGRIVLVTTAQLDDLESVWFHTNARLGKSFAGQLLGTDDFRAYYGMRNGAYFDTISRNRNFFIFWLNRTVYMALLFVFSRLYGRPERYRLLRTAAHDGLLGHLGLNKRFPL